MFYYWFGDWKKFQTENPIMGMILDVEKITDSIKGVIHWLDEVILKFRQSRTAARDIAAALWPWGDAAKEKQREENRITDAIATLGIRNLPEHTQYRLLNNPRFIQMLGADSSEPNDLIRARTTWPALDRDYGRHSDLQNAYGQVGNGAKTVHVGEMNFYQQPGESQEAFSDRVLDGMIDRWEQRNLVTADVLRSR
jgi:hypothetical protein